MAQQAPGVSVTDSEILIGNVTPYTGDLAAFGSIGKTEAAYFEMINERGGINGRKIKFLSYDDGSDPEMASAQLRKLADDDKVLFMFGSFGLQGNLAIRTYLNDRKIPQLFIASGNEEWGNPKSFPWTMGWQPAFRAEGRVYANYVQAFYPERKIAVLWQNDEFGRDLFRGLQEGLGDWARMIVADTTFDLSDKSIDSQIDLLQSSGAEILIFDGAPAVAALALRRMADIDWHPVFLLDNASASIANALRPAGLQNSIGVVSTAFLKDPGDPAWKDDPAMKDWSAFMDKYYPDGDRADSNTVFGYGIAETLSQVLKQCGDDLSRENIMRQAASLKNYQNPVALPGVVINTGPNDFRPIEQMRLVQFDGNTWQPIGEVIESAFLGANSPDGASSH
ncbi:ABC transporter substrate-binding protein [Bradyrhizobium sp. S69]|uniref:ABC transporter substrate-binding protein n=1 Tax=Bradyrhizobium sp. S69 TaxID=1641856 RepID=UPI001FEE25E8|nr:ABC transporter substrate-binding protein [Bradyrhizobium sp. S69]